MAGTPCCRTLTRTGRAVGIGVVPLAEQDEGLHRNMTLWRLPRPSATTTAGILGENSGTAATDGAEDSDIDGQPPSKPAAIHSDDVTCGPKTSLA